MPDSTTKLVTFKVPRELATAFERTVAGEDRTVSAQLREFLREYLAERDADPKPSREKWEKQQADIARWLPLRDQLRHAENELQRCEARRHHHDGPHEIVTRGERRTRQVLVDSLGRLVTRPVQRHAA